MSIADIKVFNAKNILNILISILPISFIAGNLIINLNLILIVFLSFLFYWREILNTKLLFFDKLIIIIFVYTIFTSVINTFEQIGGLETLTLNKTISFLRFLFFYFAMRFLIEKNIFNLKFFFISATLCSIFVSLDLIYQFINGEDIFGYSNSLSINSGKMSGPFGEEQIAGSYLQRFSIFSFFLISVYLLNLNHKKKIIIYISLLILFFSSMLLAGNRMPIILFIMFWSFLFILEDRIRKYGIIFFIAIIILSYLFFQFNNEINNYIEGFANLTMQIVNFLPNLASEQKITQFPNIYIKEFYSGYNSWLENFFIGGGINSFHFNCIKTIHACATHPHNYYLEILSELGLIGMILWFIVFLYLFYITIVKKYILRTAFKNNHIITPFALLFLVEIFPIKSTGSFFTTGNATFIFFIISAIIALSRKSQYK